MDNKSGKVYLLTWNILKWDWPEGFKTIVGRIKNGEKVLEGWNTSNTSLKIGDTVYLMKTGVDRGLVAKGIVSREAYTQKHWDKEKADQGLTCKYVDVLFAEALDYESGHIIDWQLLKEKFPKQNWTPQSSGISIKDEYVPQLNLMWNNYMTKFNEKQYGINIPLKPSSMRIVNGVVELKCGNCGYEFKKAMRCPECGQLVKN